MASNHQGLLASPPHRPQQPTSCRRGLGNTTREVNKDRYLAGPWRSKLLVQLLWRHITGRETNQALDKCEPSWSWVSVNGAVEFSRTNLPGNESYEVQHEYVPVNFVWSVLECSVSLTDPDEAFGKSAVAASRLAGC